jgi:hypothetical protein
LLEITVSRKIQGELVVKRQLMMSDNEWTFERRLDLVDNCLKVLQDIELPFYMIVAFVYLLEMWEGNVVCQI